MDCPICYEGLGDSALSLPCGHMYCTGCTERHVQTELKRGFQSRGRVKCPTCRALFMPVQCAHGIRKIYLDEPSALLLSRIEELEKQLVREKDVARRDAELRARQCESLRESLVTTFSKLQKETKDAETLREKLESTNAVLAKASETSEKLIEAQNTILYLADECQKHKAATNFKASKTPPDGRTNQVFLPLAPTENLFSSTFSHIMPPPPPSASTNSSIKLSESLAALMKASANLSSSESLCLSTLSSATAQGAAMQEHARSSVSSSNQLVVSSSTIDERPKAGSISSLFFPSRPKEIQQIGNICQDPIFRFGYTAISEVPTGGAASSSNNTWSFKYGTNNLRSTMPSQLPATTTFTSSHPDGQARATGA